MQKIFKLYQYFFVIKISSSLFIDSLNITDIFVLFRQKTKIVRPFLFLFCFSEHFFFDFEGRKAEETFFLSVWNVENLLSYYEYYLTINLPHKFSFSSL